MREGSGGFMIKDLPHGERPREKLLSYGAQTLSNAELLSIILGSGSRDGSALQLAGRVLAMSGGPGADLAGYQPEEFMKIPGIKEAKAARLAASLEFGRRMSAAGRGYLPLVDSPSKAARLFMEELRYLPNEVFKVLLLNVKSEMIASETVSVGGLSSSQSHPREVFSRAVRKGAYSVILMHNHPSGDPSPSEADMAVTAQLRAAGELLGIKVADHIIIGDGRDMSFREEGLLS